MEALLAKCKGAKAGNAGSLWSAGGADWGALLLGALLQVLGK
jgi:hypothetical protein